MAPKAKKEARKPLSEEQAKINREQGERLRQARIDAKFKTATSLAARAGIPFSTYAAAENGQSGVSEKIALAVAPYIKVPPQSILFGDIGRKDIFENYVPALADSIDIVGEIEAGAWREPNSVLRRKSGLSPNARFNADKQFALHVRGDSMDAAVPIPILDGALVQCAAVSDEARIRNRIVAVQRTRGDLVETTLKRAIFKDGHLIELRPESRNPIHQIIRVNGDLADEVSILGLVTGIFNEIDF